MVDNWQKQYLELKTKVEKTEKLLNKLSIRSSPWLKIKQ
jgi:hypothetical protein